MFVYKYYHPSYSYEQHASCKQQYNSSKYFTGNLEEKWVSEVAIKCSNTCTMCVYVCNDACTHVASMCVYNVHCSQRVMLCVFDERKLSCMNDVLASHHITYVHVSASVKLYLQKVLLQFYSVWPIFSHLAYLHKLKFHWDQFPRNFLADLLATSPTYS